MIDRWNTSLNNCRYFRLLYFFVQTVQLVSTATLGTKFVSAQDAGRRAKRHIPSREAGSVSSTPSKKTKINSLAPADYDHTQGTPMKKPSSPFILFARDIRRQGETYLGTSKPMTIDFFCHISSASIIFSFYNPLHVWILVTVLCEHPGADFAFVAKEMADRWKTLDADSKNHYREQAKAEADAYHMQMK